MKFGPVPLDQAEGGIAAHSIRCAEGVVRKGTRLGPADIAILRAAGLSEVVVAQLDAGDRPEDEVAHSLALRVAGSNIRVEAPFTGRSNLYADADGVLEVDAPQVDEFNGRDEAITLATLPPFQPVKAGDMLATVKIIPFAVDGTVADTTLAETGALLRVHPFVRRKVAVISTLLPGLAPKVVEKTLRVTAARLAPAGALVSHDLRVPHATGPLTEAIRHVRDEGAELVLIFGASAITDRRDVIPAALVSAGGMVERLGMPVDPGNLALLGRLGSVPVIGAPGCARSPKENGFDWLLMRLIAGLDVTAADVARLGVGGLLTEIVTRPQPREEPPAEMADSLPRVAAVLLAAGRGTRMGGPNKLLEPVAGVPVVRRVADAALASHAQSLVVVTGHEHQRVEAALSGLPVSFVHNPDYPSGMASSVRRGIAALPESVDGALILLGDMPLVGTGLMDTVIDAFAPERGRLIVVPMADEQRGNPVLWSRRFFPELMALEGDIGARRLIAAHGEAVHEVSAAGPAPFLDVDTPEALAQARALAPSAASPENAAE
ncbi:4-diphosphocytidyl-2C-methyl-D-erythritol kinase [Azorhizobium oxalatiphilum]|uniref:4-diphosphocytidyl-2C-methyl-D-erythritol kinase n=1 Tax=Azorhizobium oxalatiphilum TaxID=980631 RepID=A0A917C362_9HYPH|nr:molybdopterin-binding/glycosyltransferase family 2 protein [Azorhizobium oxalatiphilum]GGF69691.1 4-diphosphocytidyl-2C-methyl-D-erythritol kinase [Azorhizobium oxalatiphilum]